MDEWGLHSLYSVNTDLLQYPDGGEIVLIDQFPDPVSVWIKL